MRVKLLPVCKAFLAHKNEIKKFFGADTYEKIWVKADDVTERSLTLGELYDGVPKELRDVVVLQMEIDFFPKGKRRAIKKWLNRTER